ncbi:MAG: GTPase ObgE [Symbiobacteriaceae bacterium]|nr:GTPase ObgE [Symbiobacteriaceae bacterium]
MFVDQALISVRSGNGGDGRVAFRREKYVPKGGPSGGDGGRGAHVIAQVDPNMNTLLDFRYRHSFIADAGGQGGIKNMHGANATDLIFRVPAGTTFIDADSGENVADLTEAGQQAILARGGRGGRGNAHYATPANRVPEYAEKGEPGLARRLRLELRLLADVGLVGYPNAGKSTLLAALSAARPKIADYPFTTLEPYLGIVKVDDETSFVMADIPGLIEGAAQGVGLGHDFLRHIARTRLLLHIIDLAAIDGRNPQADYLAINRELALYSSDLSQRPQIVALNKVDLPQADEFREDMLRWLTDSGIPYITISALTHEGLQPLIWQIASELQRLPKSLPLEFTPQPEDTLTSEDELQISREDDAAWRVSSARLHRLVAMTDFNNTAAIKRFQRIMRRTGVDDALREAGAQPGDTVRIADMEFDFADHDEPED